MPDTSPSLLERLRQRPDDQSAWQRLTAVYQPLLEAWLRRHALQGADADDLVQEILLTVVRELPTFQYDPQRGSFRGWLRAILTNRLRAFWRGRQAQPKNAGDATPVAEVLAKLEDPASDLSRRWDREHDVAVAHKLLALIEPEFAAPTWRAFRRVVLDGARPAAAAAELGMSVNAVFIAKSRVLRRLRQELRGLTD